MQSACITGAAAWIAALLLQLCSRSSRMVGVSCTCPTRTNLASTNILLQNIFPYLGTDFSLSVQSLPTDTSRDFSLLLCQQSAALWPFLPQTKQLPANEDFLDPELFLGLRYRILGVCPLGSRAAPVLWLAHFSCGQISLKWLACSMALQKPEIIALGQLHGCIKHLSALHLNPSSGFILQTFNVPI